MEKKFSQEFFKEYRKTFVELFKKSFGWRDWTLLALAVFAGIAGSYWWKGKEYMIEQLFSYIAWSIVPLVVLSLGYIMYFAVQTPVNIYAKQKKLLSNRSWYDVEFEPIHLTERGMNIAALKIINNKPIEITDLNIKTYALYKDESAIAEQRDMYWMNSDGRLHGVLVKDRLCPNGCEGVVPIAIATNKRAYLDDYTDVVNNIEDKSKRVYLKAGVIYHIEITLLARMDTVKIPTPYPFFRGTLLFNPPNITLTKLSVTPHRLGHEI